MVTENQDGPREPGELDKKEKSCHNNNSSSVDKYFSFTSCRSLNTNRKKIKKNDDDSCGQTLRQTHVRQFSVSSKLAFPEKKTNDVLIEVIKDKAVITLNRSKALNALNLPMIREIYPKLIEWQKSNEVKLVIIKGQGERAFCAGGDIRSIVDVKTNPSILQDFFRGEYHLNHAISTSTIPWVAFLDGVTMGGGVGLSVHGHFRVATERSLFSMPETAIGLVPDVGGGFFLSRMPRHLGVFLGLTGHRLKARDLLHAGIATHFIPSQQLATVEEELLELQDASVSRVGAVLERHHKECQAVQDKAFSLEEHLSTIDEVFSASELEEVLRRLQSHHGVHQEWCSQQHKTLLKMSPTSLKVTLRQLQKGAQLTSLKEVLEMEYEIVQKLMQGTDFFEGVRAVLIDKDNSPNWKPDTHTKVTDEMVEQHFNHLPSDQKLTIQHPL